MCILVLVAALVGWQVDRESRAKRRAHSAGEALLVSERKYRGLFESSPVAVLVLDNRGVVRDANPAASILFGKVRSKLVGTSLADEIGQEAAHRILFSASQDDRDAPVVVRYPNGKGFYLEPISTGTSGRSGDLVTQVALRDVTQEQQRQAALKAFAASVIGAQEEERRRVARELHDVTIQNLILLCRHLDNAVEDRENALPPQVMSDLAEAQELAEGVVKELRGFARALRPAVLDDLGLVASIRRIMVDLSERTGIDGRLNLQGKERRLPRAIEIGLFRIAEEALRNVERHANATRTQIFLEFSEKQISMSVVDNGVGFLVPPVVGNLSTMSKLGLIGMHERAELLGGRLDLVSSPGTGTSVTVSISMEGMLVTDR